MEEIDFYSHLAKLEIRKKKYSNIKLHTLHIPLDFNTTINPETCDFNCFSYQYKNLNILNSERSNIFYTQISKINFMDYDTLLKLENIYDLNKNKFKGFKLNILKKNMSSIFSLIDSETFIGKLVRAYKQNLVSFIIFKLKNPIKYYYGIYNNLIERNRIFISLEYNRNYFIYITEEDIRDIIIIPKNTSSKYMKSIIDKHILLQHFRNCEI